MATGDNEVSMMMSVYPGAMTGFAALNSGLVSINNVFMQTIARIDDNFGILNASILATGAVVTQFATDCMSSFGEFEQGMKIVQMVSGQTAQDIEYLSQKANEFSVSYRMDIDQLTEGLQTLGRAGLNTASEQTEVLQNGLNTAKLEGRDLNGVLEELIQNTTLLGGNLKSPNFGEDSGYINDLLVATSMTAPITTHDISETLKYSGGIAAAAGAKIRDENGNVNEQGKAILEDYMGTVAAFAQKGVTGSIAGTALRAFLNKPATQDSSVTDALASIHLKPEYLWEDGEEVMKPISQQIQIIQNQMDELNVSTMDRLQIWSKIVGGKMGQQMMKLDSESIKEITKDIQSADDATSLAQGSMQTYQANVKELGEAGEAFKRSIGSNLVFFANPYLELITKIVEFGQNDFISWPISIGIIAFLGLVGTKIKAVFNQLKTEISTVMSALRAGTDMITSRQLKGDRGVRAPLPGERYTETDLKKEVTPAQLLKGFRQQFQQEAAKSLVGLTKENAAIVEASKGWSAKSEFLNTLDVKYVSDDGKSFIQARDNAVISQLARHNMLTPEIQKAFFMGTKKEEIMSTMLPNGVTVRDEIESLFLQLQAELQKTAVVLEEASVAAEEVSGAEQKKATTEKQTSQETSNAAERAAQQAKAGYESVTADFNTMWKGVNAASTETKVDVGTAAQTIVMDTEIAIDSIMLEFHRLAMGVGAFNAIPATKDFKGPTGPMPGYVSPTTIGNNMFYSKEGIPLTYSQNLALLFGEQYGNLNEVMRKGYTPFTGQMPWFMQFNTPRDLFKNGPVQFNAPTDAEARAAAAANYHGTPIHPMSNPNYVDPATVLKQQEQALEDYKENYIRTKIQTGKGVSASNYGALLRTTGIDYEALDKEAVTRRNAALEQSNIIAEEIKQELLTIANELTQQEAMLARQNANAAQNQKDMKGLANAAAINAENQAAEEEAKRIKKTLNTAGTGYPTKMSTSSPDQVHGESKTPHAEDPVRYPKGFYDKNKAGSTPGYVNPSKIQDAVNNIKSQQTQSGPGISAMAKLNSQQINQTNELIHSERTLSERIKSLTYKLTGAGSRLKTSNKEPGMWASFKGTLKDRWNADRSGRFLNFGTGRIGGKLNGALNMLDAVGGPFMVAMMAIPAIMNYVQGIYENYTKDLKEASQNVADAYSKRNQAEDSLKQTYRDSNPDATDDEINDMILDSYATLYKDLTENHKDYIKKTSQAAATPDKYEYDTEKDDGSTKLKEEEITEEQKTQEQLQKNTAALYASTSELNNALGVLVTKMSDKNWGIDGWTGQLTDSLGSYADQFWGGQGTTFNSAGGNFLKTSSQQDENYAGYTEMSGLMLEDFKDAGDNWIKGMRTMMGDDVDFYSNIIGTHTPADDFMRKSAHFASTELSPQENMRLQASMKNDSQTWKKLGKELAKYENKNKKSYNPEKGTKRIQGLINKLQATLGAGFSTTKVLQAAYLQVAQDMYSVAQTVFVPLIQQNAVSAAQTVAGVGQVYNTTDGTGTNTYNTAAIASSIAAMLGTIALAQSGDAARTQAMLGGDVDGDGDPDTIADKKLQDLAISTSSGDEFMREAIKQSQGNSLVASIGGTLKNIPISSIQGLGGTLESLAPYLGSDRTAGDYLARIYGMTTYMSVYGMDSESAMNKIDEVITDAQKRGVGPLAILNTIGKNWQNPEFVQQIEDAYLNASEGDGSSGSGSGSGSGNKDKDTGTKKERVDLVLCNKKEIPKLNVNLFKKPPTFTILNKNFKLRDVKINTEDKPKAIMASIKNAFIDVQKRSDPKIIQDEEAVYDPAGATEGNAVPSGTAKTKTNT